MDLRRTSRTIMCIDGTESENRLAGTTMGDAFDEPAAAAVYGGDVSSIVMRRTDGMTEIGQ